MKLNNKFLIGMIHLPPLLSYDNFLGMQKTLDKCLEDLNNLQLAGFDAILIENDYDLPHTEFANPSQISSFTAIAWELRKKCKIKMGIQMMLNDWKSNFSISRVVKADFSRLDVFVDHVKCKWCEINPDPRKIIEYKNKICPNLKLLTDIQPKYKTCIKAKKLELSADQAIENNSDGLVITGDATGKETPIAFLEKVKKHVKKIPVIIGAGLNIENIEKQLEIADGAIVGTSIKTDGKIDRKKAKELIEKRNKLFKNC